MTKEELLRPRYKVIADYPDSKFYVESILIPNRIDGVIDNCWVTPNKEDRAFGVIDLEKYPHLFQRLEWWQDRAPEDMPEYVKVIKNAKGFGLEENCIRNVTQWDMDLTPPRADCFPVIINAMCLEPATKEDYINYNTTHP